MVVVHRAHGFRLVIYTSDHEPAHVHIAGSGRGKVDLVGAGGRPVLVMSVGIKHNDLRRLMNEIDEHRNMLLQAWERIHDRAD